MNGKSGGPAVLIGLDAADLPRIERLAASGRTPAFHHCLAAGARGRLASRPVGLSATIWPKWFEGGRVGSWYFPKQWNPDRMCLEWTTATRGGREAFWNDLDRRGLRVCIVDVPQAPRLPLRQGIAVQGWQVHDLFDRWSEPAGLWRELERAHGAPFLGEELYGPQTPASLLALRRQVLATTEQAGALGSALMKRGPFDVCAIVLGGLHRGGHYLWDTSQVDLRSASDDDVRRLEAALDEIYVAADRAVGRLLEQAPANARVLLFSLHGMTANGGWSERFQAIAGALAARESSPRRPTWLQGLRRKIPARFARRALGLVPARLNDRLLEFTSSRMHDWRHTPWFVLPSDLAGFLRLNVIGREAAGILAPGREARAVEDQLVEMFTQLTDAQGCRIADDVERTDDWVDAADPLRRGLPDVLVNWGALKASETASLLLGGKEILRWQPGQPNDSGRSGNHATQGWFAAVGPGLAAGTEDAIHDIDGIVPAVYRWLGLEPPPRFNGEPPGALVPATFPEN